MLSIEFKNFINRFIDKHGIDILNDTVLCKALLKDSARGEFPDEIRLFMLAIDTGLPLAVRNAADIELTAKRLMKNLWQQYFLDRSAAFEIVALLFHRLRKTRLTLRESTPRPQRVYATFRENPFNKEKCSEFNNTDRDNVVIKIQEILKIKLAHIEIGKRIFVDTFKIPYVIFGGTKTWHGISEKQIDFLCDAQKTGRITKEGVLIIVRKYTEEKFEIYSGKLSLFLENKGLLSRNYQGNYQFDLKLKGDDMIITRIPSIYCEKIFSGAL
jgi:hypothetical protein